MVDDNKTVELTAKREIVEKCYGETIENKNLLAKAMLTTKIKLVCDLDDLNVRSYECLSKKNQIR